jgi:hypothetical protein
MAIPKPKRSTVVMEFMDNYERKKVYGRVLSEWSGDPTEPDVLVFETHRVHKDHFHNAMNGWAVSVEIFDKLRDMGVEKIRIKAKPFRDSEHENEVWEVSMRDAIKCSVLHQYADYDEQRFIPQECLIDPREVYW